MCPVSFAARSVLCSRCVSLYGTYMRFTIFPRIFPKLAVCYLSFPVCSAMGFLCLPLNGSPVFYHGFPVNSLLSFLSISRVFLWVSGEFCALCSSCVPRCGAPEFHHEFPVGSPITFLYIPPYVRLHFLVSRMHSARQYILCSLYDYYSNNKPGTTRE